MPLSLGRLRRSHLAIITGLYWAGLAVATLARPVGIALSLVKLPTGHGSIDAGFVNTLFHVTMMQDGNIVWTNSIYLATALAWVLGPPVLLYAAWRSARNATEPGGERSAPGPSMLSAAAEAALPAPPLPDIQAAQPAPEGVAEKRSPSAGR